MNVMNAALGEKIYSGKARYLEMFQYKDFGIWKEERLI